MKLIKLTGREMAVLRAIENQGSTGAEIEERTQIAVSDLADILNGLGDAGFVEAYAGDSQLQIMEPVKPPQLRTTRFETNPSYAQELKKALARY